MKLTLKADSPNYAAKVISLPAPSKHPKADKLQVVNITGNSVITGLDAKEGMAYIYFPLECAINKFYLAWSDSFAKPELNKDVSKKGFFQDSGRVRAVRLRSQPSEGYIVPVRSIVDWWNSMSLVTGKVTEEDFQLDTEFDHIDDLKLCEKYVNANAQRKLDNAANAEKNRRGKVKRISKLVDNQFRFHIDTKQLKREIHNISPDDTITVSYKMHGASAIFAKILCKKKLRWYEKLAKNLGITVLDSHYDYVYSSRRVVKNEYEEESKQNIHYYDTDIWSLAAQKVNPSLKDGLSIYAELVGQTPTGSWIQKPYDYGTKEKQIAIYVYRITYTNPAGDVFEFTQPQVKRYCDKMGLPMVPIFYHGKAKDLFPELSTEQHWHEAFLEALKKKYNEKDCHMCTNKVPEEGVCVILERDHFEAYKLKSFRFLEHETAELDTGAIDMETQETTDEKPA